MFVLIHFSTSGSGTVSSVFEIHLNQCGTTSSGTSQNDGQPNPVGSFVESTIIVQYDPLVQEVWDQVAIILVLINDNFFTRILNPKNCHLNMF
jgi:hypothetical protein